MSATQTKNEQGWKAKLAMQCWMKGELTWTELETELEKTGLSREELEELSGELKWGCQR